VTGSRPLRLAALAATAAGLLPAAGCGVETKDADKSVTNERRGGAPAQRQPRSRFPARPAGLVAVAGAQQGSITPIVVERFNAAGNTGTRATFAGTGENQAFRELCAGRIDVVDSVREITTAELAVCRRRGITLAPKLQVASDAVVVATRNESDVGGDCITLADVDAIFRSGSAINNWSQLGFDDLRLRTTGPDARSNVFNFFTQKVFGLPSAGGLASFRTDYQARTSEDEVRFLVANRAGLDRERRLGRDRVRRALAADARERQRAIDRAVAIADRRALAQIEAQNRRNARLRIQVNARRLAARNRRFVESEKAKARARVVRAFNARALQRARRENNAALAQAERPGTVGYFRFTYYENFEDQLRPMEIDPTVVPQRAAPGASPAQPGTPTTAQAAPGRTTPNQPSGERRPDCIFPSQTTITSQKYPLSRALLLYVAQDNVRRREVQSFLQFYLQSSQRIATQSRLVPVADRQRDDQLASIAGRVPAGQGAGRPDRQSAAPPQGGGVPGVSGSGGSG